MILVIAEKPSLARAIGQAIGATRRAKEGGYIYGTKAYITWCFGHMMALKDVDDYYGKKMKWSEVPLPFMPETLQFKIKEDQGVRQQVQVIMELLRKEEVDLVYHAGDSGREGQLIIDLLLRAAKNQKPVRRLWLPEQTEESIRRQMKEAKDNRAYQTSYEEGLARTYMDWLLGINITRMLTLKTGVLYPVGRVLIPIVKEVYDRELAIENFVPQDFYKVVGLGQHQGQEVKVEAKEAFKSLEEAEAYQRVLNGHKTRVLSVEQKTSRKYPRKLFSLSTLQAYLSKNYGMPFTRSLEIAQTLYDKKFTTYPRTDTEYMAKNEVATVKEILEGLADPRLAIHEDKRVFDDSKVSEHSAIIITKKPDQGPDFQALTEQEKLVYHVIKKRFLANFTREETLLARTQVVLETGSEQFRIQGVAVLQKGYLVFEPESLDREIPAFRQGEVLDLAFTSVKRQTRPPKKLTESELSYRLLNPFKEELAEGEYDEDDRDYEQILRGVVIGTEATRTAIIENALRYGYLSKTKAQFSLEKKGRRLIELLDQLGINLYKEKTVAFSLGLNQVYRGELAGSALVAQTRQEIEDIHQAVEGAQVQREPDPQRELIGLCPKCQSPVYENKKGYGCSAYQSGCPFVLWKEDFFLKSLGKKMTKSRAQTLMKKGRVKIKGLKSVKKGAAAQPFDAWVVADFSGDRVQFRLEMD